MRNEYKVIFLTKSILLTYFTVSSISLSSETLTEILMRDIQTVQYLYFFLYIFEKYCIAVELLKQIIVQ